MSIEKIDLSLNAQLLVLSDFEVLEDNLELINSIHSQAKKTWSFESVSFGREYSYSGITHEFKPMSEEMLAMARRIELRFGYKEGYFNHIHANVLGKGAKGIGYHSDSEYIYKLDDGGYGDVATVSFGGSATITIADDHKNVEIEFLAETDSIYIMKGSDFQRKHLHKVSNITHKRMSITFRHTTR